ncbi:U2 small nuclear ribonucleoprotein auxiliary factor 35 kDa subunit-related protein 2 [Spodoptera litura]|uniref:U2 small nuclear ribonucleoprotein auxiliary factor 35 kDa subunit-related protein 2 n=1 Tax=Spodoptera litura TaxID=69820 RepID=A0A9J7IQ82_SPOLT|nr:U2 small nuclear ribonucleoprotein auxiliary factor 35 kDa subunit-related protein 2 [Spodoptera litura]
MGRHAEWRKIAKKQRRKRIRTLQATEREKFFSTEWYIKQQEIEEQLILEQINKQNEEENEKWIKAEKIAIAQWKRLQEAKERATQKQLEQEAKMRLEYELEQERKKKEEERIKAAEEEQKRKHKMFMDHLDKFLSGDSVEPPPELKVVRETRSDAELCPFFTKTSCCRFGDQCSRNHQYPGISRVLLATNFYIHFGLSNADINEYDTDIMLEYEDSETYKEFKEFFYDVLAEFEKFGRIVQFKVCNNYEKHLRGNTYIEFAELRCAVAAYRALHTRWYGGRQLSLQFCNIKSWSNAICGLQLRRRCPKGRACNFLHVFRNPNNLFNHNQNYDPEREKERSSRSSVRSWRWSESPEREPLKRVSSRRDESSERRHRRSRHRDREDDDYDDDDDDDDRYYRRTSCRRSSYRR